MFLTVAIVSIIAFCLAANLPFLLGDSNPIGLAAEIGAGGRPGVLPGYFGFIDPNAGLTVEALGHFSAETWLHGRVPWWNPLMGPGLPLAAGMQSLALFLPFVLLLHFTKGVIFLRIVMQVLAGIFMAGLLRQLKVSQGASVLGGTLFALNGVFAWFADAPIMPIAFLPLLLLGIERAHDARPGSIALIAAGIGFSLAAGFPETAYLDGLMALAWAGARSFGRGPAGRPAAFAGRVALGGAIGLLLAAPVLLVFLSYVPETFDLDRTGIVHRVLPAASAALMLFPAIAGPPFGFAGADPSGDLAAVWGSIGGYTTLPILLLSALGAQGARSRGLRLVLVGWLILCGLRMASVAPIMAAFDLIPRLDQVAIARYCQPSCLAALIVLAMFALEDWRRDSRLSSRRLGIAIGITAALAFGAVWEAGPPLTRTAASQPGFFLFPLLSVGWALVAVSALVVLLRLDHRPRSLASIGSIVLLEALVLFVLPGLSAWRDRRINLAPVAFLRSHLGFQRFYTLGPIAPNYGSYFGIASINHALSPITRRWTDYIATHLDPGVWGPNFAGSWPPAATARGGESRLEAFQKRVPGFAATGVRYVVTPPDVIPLATPPVFRSPVANISELPSPAPYVEAAGCTVVLASREKIRADCAAPATLVRREFFAPGWSVTIDGRSAPVRPIEEIFQAVDLPAGPSAIRFTYAPRGIGWAAAAMAVGLAALVGSLSIRRRW